MRWLAMDARRMPEIRPLTGIRGLGALWVAAYHLLLPAGFVGGRMIGRGYLAVDLFFILSGFLMALNYGKLFRTGIDAADFGRFLLKRAARLYPIYGTILVFRFAYTAMRYGRFDLPGTWVAAPMTQPAIDLPANLLLVQSWGIAESSIGTAWSVSTEWGAYFLFPGLAILALWRGRGMAAALGFFAVGLILATAALDRAAGYHQGALDAWNGMTAGPMLRCLGGFTLGMLLRRAAGHPVIALIAGHAAPCTLVIALLLAGTALGAPDLAIYPLFPALVLCLACGSNRATALFGSGPLVWLGVVSYSLYLLHIFLLHPLDLTRAAARAVLPATLADIAALAVMFGVLLVGSAACYRWIEQPGRRLIAGLVPVPARNGQTLGGLGSTR
jgi:peptidoglycan/LPS O-acetylase OafA/YrhL